MEPQIRLRLNVLFKETKTNLVFNEKPEAKQVLRTKMKENPLERETGMRTKTNFLEIDSMRYCPTKKRK